MALTRDKRLVPDQRFDFSGSGSGKDKYNSAWMMREGTGRRELEVNLRRESRELGFHENRPPNYPPREVFLVLKLKFYTKIFAL
jgi:hypothetical protein